MLWRIDIRSKVNPTIDFGKNIDMENMYISDISVLHHYFSSSPKDLFSSFLALVLLCRRSLADRTHSLCLKESITSSNYVGVVAWTNLWAVLPLLYWVKWLSLHLNFAVQTKTTFSDFRNRKFCFELLASIRNLCVPRDFVLFVIWSLSAILIHD